MNLRDIYDALKQYPAIAALGFTLHSSDGDRCDLIVEARQYRPDSIVRCAMRPVSILELAASGDTARRVLGSLAHELSGSSMTQQAKEKLRQMVQARMQHIDWQGQVAEQRGITGQPCVDLLALCAKCDTAMGVHEGETFCHIMTIMEAAHVQA